MDADLEEGEIIEERLPSKKARSHKSSRNVKHSPLRSVKLITEKRTTLDRYVCKNHKKALKKENKKLNKKEKKRLVKKINFDTAFSKPLQERSVRQKNYLLRASDKSPHISNGRSTVRDSNSTSKNNYRANQRNNDHFQHDSYPQRISYSKLDTDASYEDLLNQYKSIQSQLASLQKTPPASSSKASEKKVHCAKSDSVKRKQTKSPNKTKHSKVCSQLLSMVPSKKEIKPFENKSCNISKPVEEEELDQLRRTALATCAKLPPAPVKDENAKSKEPNLTFTFMGDNYDVIDMEVSDIEDSVISQDDSINSENICNEVIDTSDGPVSDTMEMDDEEDDDDDDEEVLRAQLILALSQSEGNDHIENLENSVENTSENTSIDENSIFAAGNDSEPSLIDNEISDEGLVTNSGFKEDTHISLDVESVLENMSNASAPCAVLEEAASENGCNTVDSTTSSKTAEAMPPSAAVSDISNCSSSLNSLLDGVPNLVPKETISRNVILELPHQNANLETVINNNFLHENGTDHVVAEAEPSSISVASSSRTVVIQNTDGNLNHEPVHQTLSVTCPLDNSTQRKVHLRKPKPMPYYESEYRKPVERVVICFEKDSSESESDTDQPECDTNRPELDTNHPEILAQQLEQLIEDAKNKSEGLPARHEEEVAKSVSTGPDSPAVEAVKEAASKNEAKRDEKLQTIEAFNKLLDKLKLVQSTYHNEILLLNSYKMMACRQKSIFVTSQVEATQLREQLIRAEKLKNANQKAMFQANAKLAITEKNMTTRKQFMEKLQKECIVKGTELFGPSYSLPKIMNSSFRLKNKP